MVPYLIVSGDFVVSGGMDAANHALAAHLADAGREVHVVAHRVADDLAQRRNVEVHRVPRPLGRHLLGFPLLDRAGRREAEALRPRGVRVVANGGNCRTEAAVWLHYVHAAHTPHAAGGAARRAVRAAAHRRFLSAERAAVLRAPVVLANSERTRTDAVERLGVSADRVHAVYYGADPERFRPPSHGERAEGRAALGLPDDGRPTVVFVGALGDGRKGFDVLFAAWTKLASDPSWDARLLVVGAGAERDAWTERVSLTGLSESIVFAGFLSDVRPALHAADAVVAPSRYEAYGLAVHEAVCCGLPAIVSSSAGVAERLPAEMGPLLLADPEDVAGLETALRAWRDDVTWYRGVALAASGALRRWTWAKMAGRIVELTDA